MKNYIKLHITAVFTALGLLLLSSCEWSENGTLDGMWYMTNRDSIQSGKTANVRLERKTWSFQDNLMQVYSHDDKTEYTHIIMSRFEHSDGLLILYSPFVYDRMDGDIALTADSLYKLRPYGINSVPDTFQIEKLSDSQLQITDGCLRLRFEKY